jgi:hypothetical protein
MELNHSIQGCAMTDLDKSKFQAVERYIAEVSKQFATGKATEHSYRPALASLLSELLPKYVVTNEPRRIDCGAPDYIISKGGASNIRWRLSKRRT